jgi:Tfp pilus assembly protein PilV
MARRRLTTRLVRDERGTTLIELLTTSVLLLGLLGVAGLIVIVGVRSEPRISERAHAIQQAQTLQERLARELRQSYRVEVAQSSQITFLTYQRRTACGVLDPPPAATQPAIACRLTYACASGTCTRTEINPSGTATPLVQQMVTGLVSNAVFAYAPDSAAPEYVSMTLSFPAEGGDDAVTLQDGVDLRNR